MYKLNLTNCSLWRKDPSGSYYEIENGTRYSSISGLGRYQFRADSGYSFKDVDVVFTNYWGTDIPALPNFFNSDFTELTLTAGWYNAQEIDFSEYAVNITAVADVPVGNYKTYTFDLQNLENASVSHNEEEVLNGEPIQFDIDNDFLYIKADEGYYFNKYLTMSDEWGVDVFIDEDTADYNGDLTIITIDGNFLVDYEVAEDTYIKGSSIKLSVDPPNPPENVEMDYVGLYTLEQENLYELSQTLYQLIQDEQTGFLDINKYIEDLYILPFNIDNSISDKSRPVKLANLNLGIDSLIIENPRPVIDLGIIEVPLKYNNAYDFLNTECYVYLPYNKKISINSYYVIGQTIRIEYMLNIYTRETTINIYSTFTDHVIYTDTIEIGYTIPFVQRVNYEMLSELKYTGFNKYPYPYIEVTRKTPHETNYKVTDRLGKLIDEVGYVEVNNINLETKANNQEQDKIKSLLMQGVVIK